MIRANLKRLDVQQAADDLRRRTLAPIARPLDRLIYLASTRDYNTGFYYHDGLASRFSEEVVCEALADCHREALRDLVALPLKDVVDQMDAYMESTHTSPLDFIAAWKKLEPYRVAVPADTDLLTAEFLFSNFRIALAILESRLHTRQPAAPDASLPLLPGQ
jgi:hypothetical protein